MSASTLTRMAQGKRPDVDGLAALVAWSGLDADDYVRSAPDSSRFWPADTYRAGGPQFSFDKQFVRDYLESIHWNKQPPAPPLPEDVAAKTSGARQAYQALTGYQL